MKVFLTGATGNVGRAVLAECQRRGLEVMALVRRERDLPGVRQVVGSLEEPDRYAAAVAEADAVIHLACSRSIEPADVLEQDVMGTLYLLETWRRGPFVFMSSQVVYGPPTGPLSEDAAYVPSCWYDLGKVVNELQVRMVAAGRGPRIILRMPLLLFWTEAEFLGPIRHQLARGGGFTFGSGAGPDTFGSSYVTAGDIGRAVVGALAIERDGTFNVASGFTTWADLLEETGRRMGTRPRLIVRESGETLEGEMRLPQSRSALDTSAFERATGLVLGEPLARALDAP